MTNNIDKQSDKEQRLQNETELRILKAAEHEFLTKGFDGARTTSIAESAGVTHAMLHYYFRTKSRLFDRVISAKVELIRRILEESIGDTEKSLREMLANIISKHLDLIADNPDLPYFIVNELFSKSDKTKIFNDKLTRYFPTAIHRLQDKIDEESAKGNCRPLDATMLMLDILSLNVFPVLAFPAINPTLGENITDMSAFIEVRKVHNIDLINRYIKP